MTRLGYQIPNFTYPESTGYGIIESVVSQAKSAESSGFDRVLVMDHFYQLPMLGAPEEPMLECYTLLSTLAQHTRRVRLSSLVTGNTYRNPALLAKTVTTLDLVSNGRATLGIGAGWYQLEHDALGFEFGTFTDRFEKLEEALKIIIPMLRGENPTFEGKHFRVADAVNSPAPVSRIPIMIGGGGEKKTLRMVARYADESNLICPVGDIPRKLDVLAAHCDAIGRNRGEITVSRQTNVCVAPTMEEAEADLRAMAEVKGWREDVVAMLKSLYVFGDPDTVGEKLTDILSTGIDGLTINMPANGHVPGRVALCGEVASAALTAIEK